MASYKQVSVLWSQRKMAGRGNGAQNRINVIWAKYEGLRQLPKMGGYKMNTYKCKCGNETFKLVKRKVRYTRDTRLEPVLTCIKCSKQYNIDPCNTNGLISPPVK